MTKEDVVNSLAFKQAKSPAMGGGVLRTVFVGCGRAVMRIAKGSLLRLLAIAGSFVNRLVQCPRKPWAARAYVDRLLEEYQLARARRWCEEQGQLLRDSQVLFWIGSGSGGPRAGRRHRRRAPYPLRSRRMGRAAGAVRMLWLRALSRLRRELGQGSNGA